MFKKLLIIIPFALYFGAMQAEAMSISLPGLTFKNQVSEKKELLTQKQMSMTNRHAVVSVNNVFRDNMLLTLGYMTGKVTSASSIDWNAVKKPASYEIVLQPGEVFAFHESVLPEYKKSKIITTNAHFNAAEGFLFSGLYYGDGVCHLASLMNWAAKDAGLEVKAPSNHDFAPIPAIDRIFGTAIYYTHGQENVNQMQNLYIKNTFKKPVKFVFTYHDEALQLSIYK